MVRIPLVLLLALPLTARGDDSRLRVNLPVTAAVTGSALALWGASELAKPEIAPVNCRWCTPPGLDRSARDALRWGNTRAAARLSDVSALAVPGSLAAADLLLGGGDLHRGAEDTLVALGAVALAEVATQVAKYAVGRRRPQAWAAGERRDPDDDLSFFSGHVSGAFAAAAAFGTVARLRGYRPCPVHYQADSAVRRLSLTWGLPRTSTG